MVSHRGEMACDEMQTIAVGCSCVGYADIMEGIGPFIFTRCIKKKSMFLNLQAVIIRRNAMYAVCFEFTNIAEM